MPGGTMLTSNSFAMPCLISLLLFAEVLVFVILRREVPSDLDKPARQKMFTANFILWNLALLLMFGWAFIIVQAPQLTTAVGNIILLFGIAILAIAAFINLRAIRARAAAGKPVMMLSPENSPKEAIGYAFIGIFLILTSYDNSAMIITGLLCFGSAAMTYLSGKRGSLLSERGICKNSVFVPWIKVESYRWPASVRNESPMTILYKGRKDSVDNLTITAPEWNRTHIESFLNEKLARREVLTSVQVAQ
jgi:hypothetical protein